MVRAMVDSRARRAASQVGKRRLRAAKVRRLLVSLVACERMISMSMSSGSERRVFSGTP
jgi:hypothetical protein